MLPMSTGWQETMHDNADRWGLSHLEPPKSQPTTLVNTGAIFPDRSSSMFLDKVYTDQIRYVAYEHGRAGIHA